MAKPSHRFTYTCVPIMLKCRGDRGKVLHGVKCYIRIFKNMTSYISPQTLGSKQALDPSCFPVDPKQIRTTVAIFQDINAFLDIEVNFQNIFQCRFTINKLLDK